MAGAVALTAGLSLSGGAVTASAQTTTFAWLNQGAQTYLYAAAVDYYPGYKIEQSDFNPNDNLQQWEPISLGSTADGQLAWQIQNAGSGSCLYAAPWAIGNRGGIFLEPCNGNDPTQQWTAQPGGAGFVWQNVETRTCLDADGGTGGGPGPLVFQWKCDATDTFQQWLQP